MWNVGTDSLLDGRNHLGPVWSKGTLGHTYSRVARRQSRQLRKNEVGTLAPVTARCKVRLVGLLRGGSRGLWADPNVPRPEQTRKCERKFGKNVRNPVREKWMNDGCARLIGPRTVTTSSRGRVRVVKDPWNMMARLAEVVGRNGTWMREEEGLEPPAKRGMSRGLGGQIEACSLNVSRRSGIVVVSVFHGRAPKARRETFMTTETSLGKLSRVSEGHLKLIPRPWRSLGACRPVFGCRLLVSGSGLPEPCQKRRPWGIGRMKPKTIINIPFLGPATAAISFPHDRSYLAWTCWDVALEIKTGVDPKETGMDPEENRIHLN
ncbi:hypothetical protein CRG98_027324 [Punica granatum]|uniref:Uncharacterized protein n=1 Tax=Punica granatum TaxID=22663 RepID=A0A2I0J7Q7_PUNGR|nr:hypothetical protein CRG98_027324 [Punica granatum]